MSNNIISKTNLPPAATAVEQTGSNNLNINNQAGANVTINYNFPQQSSGSRAEDLVALQSFSHDYYQLLVTCEEDFMQNCYVTVSANRALSQYLVPPEILERCSSLSDAGISELKTFPAIICRENTELRGETDPNQFAVYGYITRIKKEGSNIKVAFHTLGVINQKQMCEKKNAIYFDLNMDCAITDLNHSSWSVHKADLFEAFKEAGITTVPIPTTGGR